VNYLLGISHILYLECDVSTIRKERESVSGRAAFVGEFMACQATAGGHSEALARRAAKRI
jgi:hypothetical protein